VTEHTIRSDKDRERLIGFISGLNLDKTPYRISIAAAKTSRSLAQNRMLWAWNGLIQKHLAEHFGQIAGAEEWHDILVTRLCPADVHVVEMPDGFRAKVGRQRTSKFTVDQMGEYLDKLDAYCAENLGLLLPRPDDYEMAVYGERRK
jgi:hypothetical protein